MADRPEYKKCIQYLYDLQSTLTSPDMVLKVMDAVNKGTFRLNPDDHRVDKPILSNIEGVANYMLTPSRVEYTDVLTIYASFHGEKQSNSFYKTRHPHFDLSEYRKCMALIKKSPGMVLSKELSGKREMVLGNHPLHPTICTVPPNMAILIFNKECELGDTSAAKENAIREALQSDYVANGSKNIFNSKYSNTFPDKHDTDEYKKFEKSLIGNGQLYLHGHHVPSYILQADFTRKINDRTFYTGAVGGKQIKDYIKEIRNGYFNARLSDPTNTMANGMAYNLGRYHGMPGAYSTKISLSSFVNFIRIDIPDKPILLVFFHCDPKVS